jgi:hypothetical protein
VLKDVNSAPETSEVWEPLIERPGPTPNTLFAAPLYHTYGTIIAADKKI